MSQDTNHLKMTPKPLTFLEKIDQFPRSTYIYHSNMEVRLAMHSHTKHQLTYIEGGVAYLQTKENSYFLPARHFVWIPAGLDHFIELRTSITMMRNIYIPPAALAPNIFHSKMGIYPVSNLILEMISFTEHWSENITKKESEKYLYMKTLGNVIASANKTALAVVLPTTTNIRLRPILRHIYFNVDQTLQLQDIAKTFSLSSRSLSRLFRENLDISFLQYVKLTRIILSMEKLLQTDLSVSEIAYASGYNSLATFSNTFYEIAKVRPSDFRKINREKSN
ncbi:helix-turn-helix transcriptional regulator [Flavobacterium frigidarium]|uniref:AraC family transcriptional regulator n=1 Tax=Flavobacterium frigidarium TaxID=99286 RepID=UPI0030DB544E|tara:strand:+ start:29416 stop:30252 length:837 start_codon:yes stop_codon:yes gene_type:complete